MEDETFRKLSKKLMDFRASHPELKEKLSLWMASASTWRQLIRKLQRCWRERGARIQGLSGFSSSPMAALSGAIASSSSIAFQSGICLSLRILSNAV